MPQKWGKTLVVCLLSRVLVMPCNLHCGHRAQSWSDTEGEERVLVSSMGDKVSAHRISEPGQCAASSRMLSGLTYASAKAPTKMHASGLRGLHKTHGPVKPANTLCGQMHGEGVTEHLEGPAVLLKWTCNQQSQSRTPLPSIWEAHSPRARG